MGAHKGYDFSGWATRFNLKCSDGRTIRDSAFRECDGKTVPMVWQHMHDSPANVLGHCVLEYRPNEGMYAYGYCNDTEMGQQAKQLVANGDITAYSIYANKLKQKGGDVLHGVIREVSLVLSGANPGACIDMPTLEHSDEETETEAYIYNDDASVFLSHEEDGDSQKEESKEESDEETEGGVKFILTDTDYVKDLAKILDDEYGITKEEFEEMIGGEIVDEDEESDEEATEEDADKEDKSEDSEDEDKPEDDIDPAELFKGL